MLLTHLLNMTMQNCGVCFSLVTGKYLMNEIGKKPILLNTAHLELILINFCQTKNLKTCKT